MGSRYSKELKEKRSRAKEKRRPKTEEEKAAAFRKKIRDHFREGVTPEDRERMREMQRNERRRKGILPKEPGQDYSPQDKRMI